MGSPGDPGARDCGGNGAACKIPKFERRFFDGFSQEGGTLISSLYNERLIKISAQTANNTSGEPKLFYFHFIFLNKCKKHLRGNNRVR